MRVFLLFLVIFHVSNFAISKDIPQVDPLAQVENVESTVKEKRCPRVRSETPDFVGSPQLPQTSALNSHLCQMCRNRHVCKVMNNCESCNKWCQEPAASNPTPQLLPQEPTPQQVIPLAPQLEDRSDLVGASNVQVRVENGFQVGTLSDGVLKDTITNLLGVENGQDVETLSCSVTTRSGQAPMVNQARQIMLNDPQEMFKYVRKIVRERLMRRVKEQEVNCLSTEDIERILDDIVRNVTSPINVDPITSSSRASEPIKPKSDLQVDVVPQAFNPAIIEGTFDPSRLDDVAMDNPNTEEPLGLSPIGPSETMRNLADQTGRFFENNANAKNEETEKPQELPNASFLRGAQVVSQEQNRMSDDVITKPLESNDPGLENGQTQILESVDPIVEDVPKSRTHHLLEKLKAKKHKLDRYPSQYPYARTGDEAMETATAPIDPTMDQNIALSPESEHPINNDDGMNAMMDQNVALTPETQSPTNVEAEDAVNHEDPIVETTDAIVEDEPKSRTHHLLEKLKELKAKKHHLDRYPSQYPYARTGDADPEIAAAPIEPTMDQSLALSPESEHPINNDQGMDPMMDQNVALTPENESPTNIEAEDGLNHENPIVETTDAIVEDQPKSRTHHLLEKLKAKKHKLDRYPSQYPYARTEDADLETAAAPMDQNLASSPNDEDSTPAILETTDPTKSAPPAADLKSRTHHLLEKLKAKKHPTNSYPYARSEDDPETVKNSEPIDSEVGAMEHNEDSTNAGDILGSEPINTNDMRDNDDGENGARSHHNTHKHKGKGHGHHHHKHIPHHRSNEDESEEDSTTFDQPQVITESAKIDEAQGTNLETRGGQELSLTNEDPEEMNTQEPLFGREAHHNTHKHKGKGHGHHHKHIPHHRSNEDESESEEEESTTFDQPQVITESAKFDEAQEGQDESISTNEDLEEMNTQEPLFGREAHHNTHKHKGKGHGHHHKHIPHHRSNEAESDESTTIFNELTESAKSDEIQEPTLGARELSNEDTTTQEPLFGRSHHKVLQKKKRPHHMHRFNEESEEENVGEVMEGTTTQKGLLADGDLRTKTQELMGKIKEKLAKFNHADLANKGPSQLAQRSGVPSLNDGTDPNLEEVLKQVKDLMDNLQKSLPPPNNRELVGSQPLENSLEIFVEPHSFRSRPKPVPDNDLVSATQHPDNMYFISNGIKLPLKQVEKGDGAVHLAIDVDRLCSCNNITCNKEETLEKILEKEPELQEMLPEDFGDVPLGMASRFRDSQELQHENSGILKRSPTTDRSSNDITKGFPRETTTMAGTSPKSYLLQDLLSKMTKKNIPQDQDTTIFPETTQKTSSSDLLKTLHDKMADLRFKLESRPKPDTSKLFKNFQKWLQNFDFGESNVLLPLTKKEDVSLSGRFKKIFDSDEEGLMEKELRDKLKKIQEYNRENDRIVRKESEVAHDAILREEIGIMGNFLKWLKSVVTANN